MRRPILGFILACIVAALLAGCSQEEKGETQWVAYVPAGDGYEQGKEVDAPLPSSTAVEVDLDADGALELVRIEDGQVYVERSGELAWEGEANWQVVDLVAGDVEDDLRKEVLLALWKEDEEGVLRSHPFIIGHRHGRYDVLWGGSAVVDPIYDLDLGDVDGDGRTELVVLEGVYGEPAGSPAHFLTVWRWNGWGFTLLWRSEQGEFHELRVVEAEESGGDTILVAQGMPEESESR